MKSPAQRESAEKLYVQDGRTYKEIAVILDCTEKTVWEWGKPDAGNWEKKRDNYLNAKKSFHEEQYMLARRVMESIRIDIESGAEPSQTRVSLLRNLMTTIPKTKEYEDATALALADEQKTGKGLTDDTIAKIEEGVFGLRR